MYVIGIDPGPVTGIVALRLNPYGHPTGLLGVEALQVTHGLVHAALDMLYRDTPDALAVAVERFVVGPRAARSSTPTAGAVTREMVAIVEDWARRYSLPYFVHSAGAVKPWATDERLAATGLLELTKGMRHARDAARHALFCAVKAYGLPDPLSQRGRAA